MCDRRSSPIIVKQEYQLRHAPQLLEVLSSGCDIVVASVNDSPHYLSMVDDWLRFWEAVNKRAGTSIFPVILGVDLQAQHISQYAANHVVHIEPSRPDLRRSALVAQLSRIIWPGTLPDSSGLVMTSDIDMFPLSLKGFEIGCSKASNSAGFVIVRNVLEADSQFPICYCVASPAIWRKAMSTSGAFPDDLDLALSESPEYSGEHGGNGWFSDQQLLYSRATAWELAGGNLVRLYDHETGHKRLDRTSHIARTIVSAPLVAGGRWTDFHAYPRSLASRSLNRWILFWLGLGAKRH